VTHKRKNLKEDWKENRGRFKGKSWKAGKLEVKSWKAQRLERKSWKAQRLKGKSWKAFSVFTEKLGKISHNHVK
jgi:hypothetical protein